MRETASPAARYCSTSTDERLRASPILVKPSKESSGGKSSAGVISSIPNTSLMVRLYSSLLSLRSGRGRWVAAKASWASNCERIHSSATAYSFSVGRGSWSLGGMSRATTRSSTPCHPAILRSTVGPARRSSIPKPPSGESPSWHSRQFFLAKPAISCTAASPAAASSAPAQWQSVAAMAIAHAPWSNTTFNAWSPMAFLDAGGRHRRE